MTLGGYAGPATANRHRRQKLARRDTAEGLSRQKQMRGVPHIVREPRVPGVTRVRAPGIPRQRYVEELFLFCLEQGSPLAGRCHGGQELRVVVHVVRRYGRDEMLVQDARTFV
jgi:hypothetical protein